MANTIQEQALGQGLLSQKVKSDDPQQFRGAAKQYVRTYGWLKTIKDFTKRRAEAGVTTPFKYLTLPGPNMTDIGVLWNAGLIESFDGKVNIAICDREYADMVAGQIRKLGVEFLAYNQLVLHEALKSKKSGRGLREHFPFDVINLDLCNALVIGTRRYSNLDALQWIFRFQRGQRFLLLLTTRANETFDDDLVRLLKHNYESEPGFEAAYEAMCEQTGLDPYQDSTLFSRLVFPKLIAKYALTFGYKIIEHFAAYYSREMRNEGHYDMLSYTFELEPLKPRDERETFFPCFDKIAENEHQEKLRILLGKATRDKAAQEYSAFVQELPQKPFVNVDQLLSDDAALRTTMQNEDKALLGWWKNVKTIATTA